MHFSFKHITRFLLICAAIAINSIDSVHADIANGLVGHWRLDEGSGTNAADSSGSSNTGTLQNAPAWIDAKIKKGVTLDGVNQYMSSTTLLSNSDPVSLCTWFKTTSSGGYKVIGYESSQTGAGSASYDRHIYVGTDGKVYFGWWSGALNLITSTKTYNDGNWHHVCGTLNSTVGYLYIDGAQSGTLTGGAVTSYSGYYRVGSYSLAGWTNGNNGYFNGSIDDVRIYNRALTAVEAQDLYLLGIKRIKLGSNTNLVNFTNP